jgi:cyclophilin family peptidyl-prolyl cis-trans isomerase
MAVKEKDPKGAEAPLPTGGWLDRLDEFGQKHARIILTVSAGLIVLTVLIIANTAYKSSLADRVARDISKAATLDALKELEDRYAGTEEVAVIRATIGIRLYQEGKLTEAKKKLEEFMEKHSGHALALRAVPQALQAINDNLKFDNEQKDAILAVPSLETHPIKSVKYRTEIPRLREKLEELKKNPERKDEVAALEREIDRRLNSPLGIGPTKLPHPQLVFKIKDKEGKEKGRFTVELFEDEAPNTVAALVELAEKKHFDGLKFTLVATDERLQIAPKALDYLVPFEPTTREGLSGSLIMVRKGDHNLPGEFQILLKSVDAPGDVTVCGIVTTDLETARKVTADDTIEAVTAEKKRSHEYKPNTVKP